MTIQRVVPSTQELDILRVIAYILGFPRDKKVEALAVINGQGELFRTQQVIELWETGQSDYLIVTGAGIGERTCRSFDMNDLIQNFGLTRIKNVYAQGYPVPDTRDHSRWVVDQLCQLNVKSVTVHASLYHLPRVFLTMLRVLIDRRLDREITIHPRPVEISPFEISPEKGCPMSDLFPGEVERIATYMAQGDIASVEECIDYLQWAWSISRSNG